MKEQKMSTIDEYKLTRAIENAATLASVNESLDRSAVLASNLKKEGIHHRFAKTASDAFNKRLTVLRFQSVDDAEKPKPFALADAAEVAELMGGEPTLQKAASLKQAPFSIEFRKAQAPMQKAASAPVVERKNYEDTVDYKTLMNHLEGMIDKHASRIQYWSDTAIALENKIERDTEQLADYFQKSACSSFEFTTLNNIYGKQFKEAFAKYLPEHTDFSKTAAVAIVPNAPVYTKVAALFKDMETASNIKDFMGSYGQGLSQFCSAVEDTGKYIAEAEYHGVTKEANATLGVLRGLGLAGEIAARRAADTGAKLVEGSSNAFDNARAMYMAGQPLDYSASKALDSEFLIKDRYRDRMLAWSDMSADPLLAMYPAEQVFQATQRAMDFDPSMERPDRREHLRAQTAQLLAQNNRYSTADIAAQATVLKAMADGTGSAAQVAAKGVGELGAKARPEAIEFKAVLPEREKMKSDISAPYDAANLRDAENARKDKEQRHKDELDRIKADAEIVRKKELLKGKLQQIEAEKKAKIKAVNAERDAKIDAAKAEKDATKLKLRLQSIIQAAKDKEEAQKAYDNRVKIVNPAGRVVT